MQDEIFRSYRLLRVQGDLTPEIQQEIITFWQEHKALPTGADARERCQQVFFVARNESNEIVALCTVYVADFGQPPEPHYHYRMFIRPADRHSGLAHYMTRRTRERLAAEYAPGKPVGLVVITENAALMNPGVRQIFTAAGYEHKGTDPRGCDIWLKRFAAAG
jgi:hypothetical protein